MYNFPFLNTDNADIDKAYRLAVSTVVCNIVNRSETNEKNPLLLAGYMYIEPWTRDTAINIWNGCGLVCPEVTENTLMSLVDLNRKIVGEVTGQSWDVIIWTIGAWSQYLYTGNRSFLKTAYEITQNTLAFYEENEFSEEFNLFRGPACYGDGIAAYPDIYVTNDSGIVNFAREKKEMCLSKGLGIPMFTLSTNCLFYRAYVIADMMAEELGLERLYGEKAIKLKGAINERFWSEEKGNYIYIVDGFGSCDSDEGLGVSFAILFGIADREKTEKIAQNQHITKHGIPCVWPAFDRYRENSFDYGRHSGTVWPFIEGFWADAMAKSGEKDRFDSEFEKQTNNALSSGQFAEIYHPETGELYGGLQEDAPDGKIRLWDSMPIQTWSATAYLRNVFMNIAGMDFGVDGIRFNPCGTSLASNIKLSGIHYRNSVLTVNIKGNGENIKEFLLNGKKTEPFIPNDISGENNIEILLN